MSAPTIDPARDAVVASSLPHVLPRPRTAPVTVEKTTAATDAERIDHSVELALKGDRRALEQLLAVLHPLIVRYCRSRLGAGHRSLSSPDDLAQEVCLAVVTALPTYRRENRPFLAFVYGIASHKVTDAHRSASRARAFAVAEVPDSVAAEPGPEGEAVAGAVATSMAALLSGLPFAQQEVLRLRVGVGLSADETADALGMTPGAVRVCQHRALTKLRRLLAADAELLGALR